MLKKLITAVIAGAFATALAAPAAMACGDKEKAKVVKKEKVDTTRTAEKVKTKKVIKPEKVKSKGTAKRVISKG
jgi:ApbE superfamily uncharacterized protein (UPF0280 family)